MRAADTHMPGFPHRNTHMPGFRHRATAPHTAPRPAALPYCLNANGRGEERAVPRQPAQRGPHLRARPRVHALSRPARPSRPAAGPRHHRPRRRARHQLPGHGLPLPGQRGLRGRRARRSGPARPRPYRHQAAARLRPHHRGPRPHLRRAAPPPAHGPYRLLPDPQRHEPRPVGSPARPGHRALARPPARGRPHPPDRLLLPRKRRRLPRAAGRLRLGLLPDPVQLRGREVPGGHRGPARRGAARPRRLCDGAAAGGRLADKLPARARRILDAAATPELATPAAWGLSWVWTTPR